MTATTRLLCAMFGLAFSTSFLCADVESGPKEGEKIAELKAYGVVGKIEGKEGDYTADRKDELSVYLFINAEKFDRPMNQFIKKIDAALPGISEKCAAIAVWVGRTDKLKERLPVIQKSVKYENTSLGLFEGDVSTLKGWGLNSSAHLTVVVANKGKVVKSFAYESVNGTDASAVEEVLRKAVK